MCVDSDNYYLLAHSERHGVTHYRVDRMMKIETVDESRTPCPELTGAALKNYDRKMFQMYFGQTERVKLRMASRLAGVVYDRFGEDTMLIPDGENWFTFVADVAVSPMFLSWVIGFGTDIQILHPASVQKACAELCRQTLAQYEAGI